MPAEGGSEAPILTCMTLHAPDPGGPREVLGPGRKGQGFRGGVSDPRTGLDVKS